jgi:hypothetical protein
METLTAPAYSYELDDGRRFEAQTAAEVFERCPVLGKLAIEAPEDADLLLMLAASGSEMMRTEQEATGAESIQTKAGKTQPAKTAESLEKKTTVMKEVERARQKPEVVEETDGEKTASQKHEAEAELEKNPNIAREVAIVKSAVPAKKIERQPVTPVVVEAKEVKIVAEKAITRPTPQTKPEVIKPSVVDRPSEKAIEEARARVEVAAVVEMRTHEITQSSQIPAVERIAADEPIPNDWANSEGSDSFDGPEQEVEAQIRELNDIFTLPAAVVAHETGATFEREIEHDLNAYEVGELNRVLDNIVMAAMAQEEKGVAAWGEQESSEFATPELPVVVADSDETISIESVLFAPHAELPEAVDALVGEALLKYETEASNSESELNTADIYEDRIVEAPEPTEAFMELRGQVETLFGELETLLTVTAEQDDVVDEEGVSQSLDMLLLESALGSDAVTDETSPSDVAEATVVEQDSDSGVVDYQMQFEDVAVPDLTLTSRSELINSSEVETAINPEAVTVEEAEIREKLVEILTILGYDEPRKFVEQYAEKYDVRALAEELLQEAHVFIEQAKIADEEGLLEVNSGMHWWVRNDDTNDTLALFHRLGGALCWLVNRSRSVDDLALAA